MMHYFVLFGMLAMAASATSYACDYNVTVVNAKNLPDEDTDYLSWFGQKNYNDAYVEVIGYGVGGEDKMRSLRTRTIDESELPQWDEKFSYKAKDPECGGEYEKFIFKVYDDDTVFGSTVWGLYNPDFLGESKFIYVSDIEKCDYIYAYELELSRGNDMEGNLFVEISKAGACCSSGGDSSYEEAKETDKIDEELEKYEEMEKKVEEEYKELEKEIEYQEEKVKGSKTKRRLLNQH